MDISRVYTRNRTKHISRTIREVGKGIPQLVMCFHTLWSPTRSRIDGNHCPTGENQQDEKKQSHPKPELVNSALFISKKGVLFHHTNPDKDCSPVLFLIFSPFLILCQFSFIRSVSSQNGCSWQDYAFLWRHFGRVRAMNNLKQKQLLDTVSLNIDQQYASCSQRSRCFQSGMVIVIASPNWNQFACRLSETTSFSACRFIGCDAFPWAIKICIRTSSKI